MKNNIKLHIQATSWMVCTLLLGLSQVAEAGVFAVSRNTISNFGVSFSASVGFTPFTFSNDIAALNGFSSGNAGVLDAGASCINCSFNNSFSVHGLSADYAYGDAQIANANVAGGGGAASSIGDAALFGVGTGSGFGANSLVALLNISSATAVSFNFKSDPYLQVLIASGSGTASASLSMSITINDLQGNSVFNWVPDGVLSDAGIIGGVEAVDSANLNRSLSQFLSAGGAIYDPVMDVFSATSDALAPGYYMMNVAMNNSAFVMAQSASDNPIYYPVPPTSIPEPGTILLAGIGMIGLIVGHHKRLC